MRDVVVVPSWVAVASLVAGARPGARYPVLNDGGTVVGVLDLGLLATRPDLHSRLAGDVCSPLSDELARRLVLENGRLVGIRAEDLAGNSLRSAS